MAVASVLFLTVEILLLHNEGGEEEGQKKDFAELLHPLKFCTLAKGIPSAIYLQHLFLVSRWGQVSAPFP